MLSTKMSVINNTVLHKMIVFFSIKKIINDIYIFYVAIRKKYFDESQKINYLNMNTLI